MAQTIIDQQVKSGLGVEVIFPNPGQIMRRRMLAHKSFLGGGGIVLVVFLIALFAPVIAPHSPYHQDLTNRVMQPVWNESGTWEHPFGTDNMGRDYLSRVFYGARISLLIGFASMMISASSIALPLTCLAHRLSSISSAAPS